MASDGRLGFLNGNCFQKELYSAGILLPCDTPFFRDLGVALPKLRKSVRKRDCLLDLACIRRDPDSSEPNMRHMHGFFVLTGNSLYVLISANTTHA